MKACRGCTRRADPRTRPRWAAESSSRSRRLAARGALLVAGRAHVGARRERARLSTTERRKNHLETRSHDRREW